jgi:hypothetical protein
MPIEGKIPTKPIPGAPRGVCVFGGHVPHHRGAILNDYFPRRQTTLLRSDSFTRTGSTAVKALGSWEQLSVGKILGRAIVLVRWPEVLRKDNSLEMIWTHELFGHVPDKGP